MQVNRQEVCCENVSLNSSFQLIPCGKCCSIRDDHQLVNNFREPNVKRTICKRCGLILLPGTSSDLTIETEHKQDVCKIQCTKCGFRKNYVLNEKYDLWLDNEASIKEVIESNPSLPNTTQTPTTGNNKTAMPKKHK